MNQHKFDASSLLASLRVILAEMRHPARLSALGLGALAPLAAFGNPTGGQVVGGSATISSPSANGTVINQSSQRAVINWQQFSVGSNQYVQFVQPNSSAVVLNRVIGSNPSSIFGNITANGQVFLVNPNGILFAPGATLDVAGLVASTLDVSDADFMQGNYVFSRGSSATPGVVQNQGSIVAGPGGYVVLAGDYVENDGHIEAQSGRVYLAAGDSATLTFDKNQLISYTVNGATLARLAGVNNTGEITADGGAVVMTADVGNALVATAVNNSGFVAAHSIKDESGVIVLSAEGGGLVNSGTLDASAVQPGVGGGTVIVHGGEKTELAPTSVITTAGDGAQGGFIDLSGHDLAIRGEVTSGRGGKLLIDPASIDITSGSTNGGQSTNPNHVGIKFIANALNAGNSVEIVASTAINYTGASGKTLLASNALGLGKTLKLEIGTVTGCGIGGVCSGALPVPVQGNGAVTLTGLTINIKSNFTVLAGTGNVTLGAVTAGAITITGYNVVTGALHATGPAASGNITVTGSVGSHLTSNGGNVTINGSVVADHGAVSLHGAGGGDSSGGNVNVSGNISAAGAVSIHGDYTGTSKSDGGGRVHLANVTGKSVNISVFSSSPRITVGNVTATGAGGSITLRGSGSGGGTGSRAGLISAGALTAANGHGAANVSLTHINAAGTIKTGAIDAPLISVFLDANGDITTGPLTAVSTAASANVSVDAHNGAAGAANHVIVNGDITAQGKVPTTGSGPLSNTFGAPAGAQVLLEASGSCTACAHDVQLNGNAAVTAIGRHFTHSSNNESGPTRATTSGSGGLANFMVVAQGAAGSGDVTGAITVTGPTAAVSVRAHNVAVHNVTVTGQGQNVATQVTVAGKVTFTSHNSAGGAVVDIGGGGSTSVATQKLTAGNITVSGKGFAMADLLGSNVSAGNVAVSATAAKGSIHGGTVGSASGPGNLFAGISGQLGNGSISAGLAMIEVAKGRPVSGSGSPAANIKLGNLSATGVGRADIQLDAKAVSTGALSAVATKGTEKGTGSSQSGVTAVNTFTHTFNINGGDADIKIRSGNSGSHSSGVLTQNGGPVTIAGNVIVSGPTARMDVKAKSIKIGGTVAVTGSGGSAAEKTVFTPAAGTGYTTSFSGPGEPTSLNLQGAISGSVSVAGKTTVKGPGLVGMIAIGGAVKLHGLSGSASAVKNYSVLDTRVSPNAVNFTAGSLAVVIDDVKVSGGKPAFTAASDAGDMKLSAKGNVDLATRVNVSGTLLVEGVGSIFGTSHNVVTHFTSIDKAHPYANSGGNHGAPSPGILPTSALQANAMAMVAGKAISLSGTQLTIGNGSISSVHGDSTLIAALATEGLAPASVNPNGAFIGGGAVTLGDLQLTGTYLLLQGSAVSVLGKVSTPKGTLVQVEPFDSTASIDIEDSTLLKSVAGSAALTQATGSTQFGLTNASFISLFPGDTVVVGGTGVSGIVTIGANGPLDIGDTNLIIYSVGGVTGLSTVTSTGIVQSLISLLGPPVPPVTAGEVDPTAGSGTNTGLGDQTDKRKIGGGGDEGGGNQPAGTVSQDTGNASVCH